MRDADATHFDRDGYLHIKHAIDPRELESFRRFILGELARHQSRLLADSAILYPQMQEFLRSPKLLSALNAVLGSPFLVLPPTSVDHNRFGQFHKDTTALEITGRTFHKDANFRAVVLGIYLQDNNEYGGGLRVVPGTHRDPDPFVAKITAKHAYREHVAKSPWKRFAKRASRDRFFTWQDPQAENMENQIDVPTKVGDALFWDMRLLHRASPQQTKGEALPGGKVALFYTLGADNAATRQWLGYQVESGEINNVRLPGQALPPDTPEFRFL